MLRSGQYLTLCGRDAVSAVCARPKLVLPALSLNVIQHKPYCLSEIFRLGNVDWLRRYRLPKRFTAANYAACQAA